VPPEVGSSPLEEIGGADRRRRRPGPRLVTSVPGPTLRAVAVASA